MTKETVKSRPKQIKGRFKPGQSGNPNGRPRGLRNHVGRRVMEMLEAESESVTVALIERAKAGDSVALRIVMDRLAPPHKTPAREPYEVGVLDTVNDCVNALRRIATDVASGELPGDHADEIAARIRDQVRMMEVEEFEQRLEALERASADNEGARIQ